MHLAILALCVSAFLLTAHIVVRLSGRYGVADIAVLAATTRLVLCVLGVYMVLPFGGADAITFVRRGELWAQGSWAEVWSTVNVSASYVISSVVAVLYKLLEPELAVAVFLNGILGLLIFYYAVKLTDKLWSMPKANRVVAFIVALHPMLIIHSAIVMRENFVTLFIIIAAFYLVAYLQERKLQHVALFFGFTCLSAFFHGGMFLFALGLPLYVFLSTRYFSLFRKLLISAVIIVAATTALNHFSFGKLSALKQGNIVERLERAASVQDRLGASTRYLENMIPSHEADLIWQTPVQIFYFLAKPFPWDVKGVGHFLVMIDAALWWLIMFLVFKHWPAIKRNPGALVILLSVLIAVAAFAWGTYAYGTAVRHRTKFLVLALAVVGPWILKKRLVVKKGKAIRKPEQAADSKPT